jgi:hypothetical protein
MLYAALLGRRHARDFCYQTVINPEGGGWFPSPQFVATCENGLREECIQLEELQQQFALAKVLYP